MKYHWYLKKNENEGAFDPEVLKALCAALDQAWKAMEASGTRYDTDKERQAVRDALAKHICKVAKLGEHDSGALARDALIHLALTQASKRGHR